ncbi:flagellar hook-length control protein FliK [Xanthomonas sacchari]|uniref:flagellar hook-length control protein FliK n=1 Tax=unclassified Xanthomonas TaxID=2643310 RepID=UPI001367D3D5|nr:MULTISPECIES: flagellar hook-length control protein FliK [unclassified Xanthomonas]MBB6366012.1 flagellar hook-length control protein FliK [Xanthomonas sp. F10]MXV33406.1 flagellar hook-length control protein FliK [Xanthomonas sp. LMG 8989]
MNNALSALGGSGRASQIGGGNDSQGADRTGGRDKDFAKLLGGGGSARTTAPKPAARETAKPAQGADKDQADKRPAAADDAASDPARTAQAGDKVAQDTEKSSTETKASGKDKGKAEDKRDDAKPDESAWPPAGLAGIGLGLLPAIGAAVLPAATATPLGAAAGLAVGVAGAVASGAAALLGGSDALPQAAAGATDPNAATAGTAGTAPASAAGGFGAMLLAQAGAGDKAGGAETAAPLAALAAIAAAAGGKSGDGGDAAPAADPSAIAPTAAATPLHAATRLADPQPFSGSPTPTPNLHGNQFDEELGARISWLADQKIGHAHIKLNPAELGPVEVRLHMTGDQVNASFSSNQADVRQALENSLPRLRDMLGQHGFQLGQADVGQQQPQQQQANAQGTPQGGSRSGGELADDLSGSVGIPAMVLRQRGLLDAYA